MPMNLSLGLGLGGIPVSEGVGYRGSPSTVLLIGDSQSVQNFNSTTGLEAHGHAVAMNKPLGAPMTLINGGVSGDGTQDVIARLDALLDANPTAGTAIIRIGTNNPGKGINAADTITDIKAICRTCRTKGVRPVVMTVTPRTDQGSGGLLAFIQAVNAGIIAATEPFAVIDAFTALADPGNSLLPYANALVDAVHDAINGASRIAVVGAPVMAAIVGSNGAGTSAPTDFREYAANPMALGDNADTVNGFRLGTGITGTGPNGWTTGRRGGSTTAIASKSGAAAQIAGTLSANFDGPGFRFGGDDVLAVGRYDVGWAAATARAEGYRARPTVFNGFTYRVLTPGTSGAVEPTWPTEEGAIIADGVNGLTWICQRRPTAGDIFYAEAEVAITGLTGGKWAVPRLVLNAINTSASGFGQVVDNFVNLASSTDFGLPDYAPSFQTLKTPPLTLGSDSLRYLLGSIDVFGSASTSVTLQVLRASIRRLSP